MKIRYLWCGEEIVLTPKEVDGSGDEAQVVRRGRGLTVALEVAHRAVVVRNESLTCPLENRREEIQKLKKKIIRMSAKYRGCKEQNYQPNL